MGCKSSKDGKEDKNLNAEFKKIGIDKLDAIFDNIKETLATCESIRAALEDSKAQAAVISHVERLVDGKYEDNVQMLLWALSANAKGDLVSAAIKFKKESPYIELSKDKLTDECEKLYDVFEKYITTIVESPEKLKKAVEKLGELETQVPDAMKAAKEEITGGSAGFKEKLEMAANMAKCAKEAGTKIAKSKKLTELLADAANDMKAFVTKLPDMFEKADATGAKAFKAGHLSMAQILEHYHPGEKKKEQPKAEVKK